MACLLAISNLRYVITDRDILAANTLLMQTEYKMADCLSDFGLTKNVRVRNTIIKYMESRRHTTEITTLQDIVEAVSMLLSLSEKTLIQQELATLRANQIIVSFEIGTGSAPVWCRSVGCRRELDG